MGKWTEKQERIFRDMEIIEMAYLDKHFINRLIRFLRDNPERALDYIDFVPDWKTRNIDYETVVK